MAPILKHIPVATMGAVALALIVAACGYGGAPREAWGGELAVTTIDAAG